MVDEIDRIVRENGLYVSRQQFIEAALRERIESARFVETSDAAFENRVRMSIIFHAIMSLTQKGAVPADHFDMEQVKRYIRRTVEEKGQKEGEKIYGEAAEQHG
jgi:Arc/MetJ-type ribon-helix-helix transcriptional regulator